VKRVFLYIRVSTEEQAIHGLSIEAQTAALEEWACSNRHKVVGTYVDAGISARKPASKRPELQRLLDDVRAGAGELIVFTKLDRWFRNIAEYYKVQEVLEKNHVDWKTIHEDYDTTTASGRLKINIMLSVAQDEADRTGERIKAVFENKIKKGEVISGKVPLGYKIEGKKLVPDPETAPVAQDIFKQYTVIRSINSLRKYILDQYGMAYWPNGLKLFLQNERYIGRAHGQDDFCPPIIDYEQFQLVQDIMEQRSQRNSVRSDRIYLFTGLVYCAECGNRLSSQTIRGKYIYYRCTRSEKLNLCPHKKRTSELILEKWLLENLVSSCEEYNLSVMKKASVNRLPANQEKIKRKMEKLKDLYLNDLIEKDAYEKEYVALRDELRAIHAPQFQPPKVVDIKSIQTVLGAYDRMNRKEKKEFWGRVIGKIVITKEDHFFVAQVRHN
jgi:site-specific DNA recombinase